MPTESRDTEFNLLIRQLFHDDDWQKRAEAARRIGLLKDKRASNMLWRAIKSEKEYMVINKIIEAMGKIGDPKFTITILDILKEEIKRREIDKFRITYILECLSEIKDKRALPYIGHFLTSSDEELEKLAQDAFDVIEPNWREIVKKEKQEKSIEEIFKIFK